MKAKITQQYSSYHKMLAFMASNHLSKQWRQLFFELIGLKCTKLYQDPDLQDLLIITKELNVLKTQEKQYGATQTQSPMTTMGKARSLCMCNILSDRIWKVTYQVTRPHYTYHNSTTWNNWRIHCKMPLSLLPEWVFRVWQSFMWTRFCLCILKNLSQFVKMLWKVLSPGLFLLRPCCDGAQTSPVNKRNELRAMFTIL